MQVIGDGGKENMKRKIRIDDDMPIGKLTFVKDFLPPPHKLVFPDEGTVKVTLELTQSSVMFFKREAKKNHTKYQRMIREVVDRYAKKF